MAFKCPHCEATARRVSYHASSERTQKAFYQCTNLACGHTFMSQEEIVCTTLLPETPNPDVCLPISLAKLPGQIQTEIFQKEES